MKEVIARIAGSLYLAAAALLPAQQRQPLFGTVTAKDGTPLQAATVTIIENDVDQVGIDPVDILEVKTDRRGRFVASALRGVRYSAIAIGHPRDGESAIALSTDDLACGRRAQLTATAIGKPRRVVLPNLERWGESRELQLRLKWRNCAGYYLKLPFDDEGGVQLPPSSVLAEALLYGPGDERIGGVWIPKDGNGDLMVPTPGWVDVLVVDDADKPVAGASITVRYERHCGTFATVGQHEHYDGHTAVTDKHGEARIRCEEWRQPFDRRTDTFIVTASKDGFAEGASGWLQSLSFVDWSTDKHKHKQLRIPLRPVPDGERREPAKASAALAGRRARLFAMANVEVQGRGVIAMHYLPRSYDITFEADGSWQAPATAPTVSAWHLELPRIDGRRVQLQPSAATELPSADLHSCHELSLQLLDTDGGPASDAAVILVARNFSEIDFRHLPSLVPDQAGKLEALLQEGDWTLLAMDGTSWATIELDAWSGPRTLELQLREMPSRRVRVLTANGQPAAGASFEPGRMQRAVPPNPGLESLLRSLGWNTLGGLIRPTKTDANGEATLHFLPAPNARPTAFAWTGDFRTRTEDFELVEHEDVHVVRIR